MMERLSDITERMRRVESQNDFLKFVFCLLTHNGDLSKAALTAELQFGRNAIVGRVLKSAIAAGSTSSPGWASELSDFRVLTSEWVGPSGLSGS